MQPLLFVLHLFVIAPAILGQPLGLNFANFTLPAEWSAESLAQVVTGLSLVGAIGIMLIGSGYRLFRQCVPVEIERKKRE